MKFEYSTLFFIRNIKRNAQVRLNGILPITKSKLSKIFYYVFFAYFVLLYYLRNQSGKLDMPQIEFALTTDCNLKCEHCYNYTPFIFNNDEYLFDEYKQDLDKLLKNVDSIQYVSLSGGEPFLHEELDKFIEYTASKKQIKNVIVSTNGTLLPNNRVINAIKKHRKKVYISVTDFSTAKNLDKTILRTKKLINLFKRNKIKYFADSQQKWHVTSARKNFEGIPREELLKIYSKCINPCLSCFAGKINPCPKATSFKFLDLCDISENQYLDIRGEDFSKQKIKQWYSDIQAFNACGFCNIDEDKKHLCNPGEQYNNNLYW